MIIKENKEVKENRYQSCFIEIVYVEYWLKLVLVM